MSDNDLSEYERLRLENIRRNSEFLNFLGLSGVNKIAIASEEKNNNVADSELIDTSKSAKRKRDQTTKAAVKLDRAHAIMCIRSSNRIKKLEPEYGSLENPDVPLPSFASSSPSTSAGQDNTVDEIDYSSYPEESRELDDFEFEVFVLLRKWRLDKSRAEEIEPYKIFQNKTLCEAIRRRRNDENWASLPPVDNSSNSERKLNKDVFDCWGIGPSKGKPGGVAEEMLTILERTEIKDLLIQSRILSAEKLEI